MDLCPQASASDYRNPSLKRPARRTRVPVSAMIVAAFMSMTGCMTGTEHSVSEASGATVQIDYERARSLLSSQKDQFIRNDRVTPNWIGQTDAFWYRRVDDEGGIRFLRVDPSTGRKRPAFDHEAVASSLSEFAEQPVSPGSLPFDWFEYNEKGEIVFEWAGSGYVCGTVCGQVDLGGPSAQPGKVSSPDGEWMVYFKDHNLWAKSADHKHDFALTSDGELDKTYGISVGTDFSTVTRRRFGLEETPLVMFSPDGQTVLTQRIDQRLVEPIHLLEYAPEDGRFRPKLHSYRYAFALDEHKPMAEFFLFDLQNREARRIDHPAVQVSVMPHVHPSYPAAVWREDSEGFYFIDRDPLGRGYKINAVDAKTGSVVTLAERRAARPVFPAPTAARPGILRPVGNDGVIWWSDEPGWGHLFYSANDGSLQQLTQGEWTVLDLLHVDEGSGTVYFIRGRSETEGNPYHAVLSSVQLDGSGFKTLTPEPGLHEILPSSFSPSGKYFIDNYSSTDNPGVASLRRSSGELVAELETADISRLEATGIPLPETFTVMAADGRTRIWGKLFKPSTFDAAKSYPVIDSIYPGPQSFRVGHNFAGPMNIRYAGGFSGLFGNYGEAQALAELGFIVVILDGRGTAGRSREFHYGSGRRLLGEAGHLGDHVAAIQQLSQTRAWMDLSRVGIYGHSGGGYASTQALLQYPDFFKVAVASAGNHEQRAYLPLWGEAHLGTDDLQAYELASTPHHAERLEGKLMIAVNLLDDDVHPAASYQLMQALIEANKSFDVMILPNANHHFLSQTLVEQPYFRQRKWEYFVEHLLGVDPQTGE